MSFNKVIAVAAIVLAPQIAIAQERCDVLVDDQAHVISDAARVTVAAKSLGNTGVTPRIRTIESLGEAANLDKFAVSLRDQCPSWQNGGGWKSTMLLLVFAPHQKNDIGIYYGASNVSKLGGGKWQDILRDRFVPQVVAFDHGDKIALTLGFVNTLTEIQAVMARPSIGGATTINQTADYSGLWTALKWLVLLMMLAALVGGIWIFFTARGRRQSAQAEARRVRSECVSGILDITDETNLAVLAAMVSAAPDESRASLERKLDRYKAIGASALATLSAFDNMAGEDPNNKFLSIEAYGSNRKRYESIIAGYVNPAMRLRNELNAGDASPSQSSSGSSWARPESQRSSWSQRTPAYQPTAPAAPSATAPGTIIVHESTGDQGVGFVTGMLLGDAMARNREAEERLGEERAERHRRWRDDASSNDGGRSDSGGSFNADTSARSDSGGSFNVDTSSGNDSGGSTSSSDSGGSSSSC